MTQDESKIKGTLYSCIPSRKGVLTSVHCTQTLHPLTLLVYYRGHNAVSCSWHMICENSNVQSNTSAGTSLCLSCIDSFQPETLVVEIRNKQVTPAIAHLGYHKRPPVKWKPLTSPNVRGKFGKNLRIMETSSHFQNHLGVTTVYRIPYSKVLNGVRKGPGREHQKCADTNVVPSRRSVKWCQEVRGGGCRSQVVKMRRTGKNDK